MSGKKRHATIIGVPLDYGASKRGASGGPAAVRRANLVEGLEALDLEVTDAGDLVVPKIVAAAKGKLKNGAAILKVCQNLEKQAYEAVANGSTPITPSRCSTNHSWKHSIRISARSWVSGTRRRRSCSTK